MSKNPVPLRARDSDRADVCAVIDAALADGQLTASEHAARSAEAMRAETFAVLDRLIDDLQTTDDFAATPVARGVDGAARRWWIPVAAILAAGVVGLATGLLGRTILDASEPLPDLTTADGLAYFVAEYRAEFGTTVVDEVTVHPGHVSVSRAGAPGSMDSYTFRGDFDGGNSPRARPVDAPTLDLATLDLARYARIIAGAPQTIRLPDARISHVLVDFPAGATKDAVPEVTIYVRNDRNQSGHLKIALDGEPLSVYPYRP